MLSNVISDNIDKMQTLDSVCILCSALAFVTLMFILLGRKKNSKLFSGIKGKIIAAFIILICLAVAGAGVYYVINDYFKKDDNSAEEVIYGAAERMDVYKDFPQIFTEGKFNLEAHRGICNKFPENTIPSFQAAADEPSYAGIETDVQITKDGIFVCMHDKDLKRTTDAEGKIEDYTFEEIKQMKIDDGYGWSDEYEGKLTLPTLDEYLDICETGNKIPYIEIKFTADEAYEKLIDTLDERNLGGHCVISSFKLKDLKKIAKLTDDYPLEYMYKEKDGKTIDEIIDEVKEIKNIIIRPGAEFVTQEMVEACEAAGIKCEVYSIAAGDKKSYDSFLSWGVLGGTCNDFEGFEEE